jgi:secondary thiamine-phosphate synthase enzyme
MLKEIAVITKSRIELINIDREVGAVIGESGIKEGMCHLWVPHTTAGITVNENADPDVVRDLVFQTAQMVPDHNQYRHGEGNSDAHIKSCLFGAGLSLIVSRGILVFGTWQSVFFCEFDGPRKRRLLIKVVEG